MKILFCGDIVINNPNNFALSNELQNIIDTHEIRCCNFEAPIVDNIPTPPIVKAGPSISQTSESAMSVVNAGFNLISIANNHIMDFGRIGLKKTLDFFNQKSIKTMGAGFTYSEIYTPHTIIDEKQRKIKILPLAQAGFGLYINGTSICGHSWINHPDILSQIHNIRKDADILIIFSHAGLEDEIIPLPEWQSCYRNLIDCGVDIIIATHPHIVQGIETYKNKKIFYSLGNFYFDMASMKDNIEWNRSIAVSIDTNSLCCEYYPISFNNNVLDIDTNTRFLDDIQLRSSYLDNHLELERATDILAEKLWEQYYKSYYLNLTPRLSDISIYGMVKIIIKRILYRKKPWINNTLNETMLLHNIQIETHRWLVERYLYNKNIEANKGILR